MGRSAPPFSYDDALAFLYGRMNYELTAAVPYRSSEFKLQRMRELLGLLGNPQQAVKIVHVAGTKGKGSTSAMIAAVLSASRYRTGLYTSPHLDCLRQRMTVDSQICSEAELIDLVENLYQAGQELEAVHAQDGQAASHSSDQSSPTFFEMTTAMALLHFARCDVDVVVLEVGLGGRLDSTNVCQPLVSVITNISFDHTQQLGNTLAHIAAEKAGIIKPGVPVVSGVTTAEAAQVIEHVARRQNAPLFCLGKDFDYEYVATSQNNNNNPRDLFPKPGPAIIYSRNLDGHRQRSEPFRLELLGKHQAVNAAIALAAIDRLHQQGMEIHPSAIAEGMSRVRCPARIEIVATRPTVIIDAGHNVASIQALIDTLGQAGSVAKRILVFATSKDKDANGMLERLLPRFQKIILTRYVDNPRSADPHRLLQIAQQMDSTDLENHLCVADNPRSAWQQALAEAGSDHLICITGSFFLAAEMRRFAVQQQSVDSTDVVTALL